MIEVKNLFSSYGRKMVLDGISLSAGAGKLVALVGPNGSGKSTLIKTLAGVLPVTRGDVRLDGRGVNEMPLRAKARRIAYLSQEREASPAMTVRDVVEIGRAPYRGWLGRVSEKGRQAIDRALERVEMMDYATRLFSELSGGEQARVLLARALAVEARVLLVDEPIASLDPFYQLTLMRVLKEEAASGALVIAALHDLALASEFADIVWMMKSGGLASVGHPNDTLTPETIENVFGVRPPEGGFKPAMLPAE